MQKGDRKILNVTQTAKHRIMAGLGWDPTSDISFLEKINDIVEGKKSYHDLDLACFLFDRNFNVISHVSADPGKSIDETGKVFHSGDNVEGYGDGDDEEISVELLNLDKNIEHIVFTAEIRTGHDFTEISNPEIRLADGYSDHNFLVTQLTNDTAKDKSAYAFTHIYREDNQWAVHYLDEYLNTGSYESWVAQLTSIIKA